MKSFWLAVTAFAAGALIVGLVMKRRETAGNDAGAEESKSQARAVHTNSQALLKLDLRTQERIGLKAASLEAVSLKPEVKGYGRVVDPAPLVALASESANARTALQVSTKEFERLKVLHAQNQNVATRALEAAEAAMTRDRIAVDAAQLKLLASWGKPIGSQPDLPKFVASLAALESALVRVDLPAGETPKSHPVSARLFPLTAETDPVGAEFLGGVPVVDPQTQGRGFLFLARGGSPGLLPGAAVTAYLAFEGEPTSGVVVPRSAVVRYQGKAWVFARTGEETFRRIEIALDHPVETGWFVSAGLTARDSVVVSGAQILLSEEINRAVEANGNAE